MLKRIIVDTRERQPFLFKGYKKSKKALKTGDYSVQGQENQVAVERKSAGDIINTIMTNRNRFEKELQRAAKMKLFCIVVESSMAGLTMALAAAKTSSSVNLRVVLARITALSTKYKVPVFFCDNRSMAELITLEILRPFLK